MLWENFTKICIFMIQKIKMSRLPVFLLSIRDKFVAISRISFFGEIVLCNRAFSVSTRKNMAASGPTAWFQTLVNIKPKSRGVHIITDEIESIPELKKYKIGLAHLLLQHTSASICVNECWDSSVRKDMEMMLNRLVPESGPPYKHTIEGPDDMPGHVKTALVGPSLTLPITNGKLNLGTWQGIWLCEHRNHAGSRKIVVTLQGVQ